MPNLTSRFGYVPYDEIAAREQNQLRDMFMAIESEILSGRYANLSRLVVPVSEYQGLSKAFIEKILNTPLDSPENISIALKQCDMLYYTLGKDIRSRCIARFLAPSFAYDPPAWLNNHLNILLPNWPKGGK